MLTWEKITLKLRKPFRLSYGSSEERQAYWIRLNGDEGWGEGTIPPYYQVSSVSMEDYWRKTDFRREPLPNRIEAIAEWIDPDGPAPARAAVDLALHDYLSKQQGLPLYAALGLEKPLPKPSSFTISVDNPEVMAEEALQVRHFPIIKIKLAGDNQDIQRLEAVRVARPEARLLIDANAGWTITQAEEYLLHLERLNVELLEQPLSLSEVEGMGRLQALTRIPIVADESVRTIKDVEALALAGVHGVNIKLMKVGGISSALEMIHLARHHKMKIMLGCMIETSIGVTAMAHLAGLADWLDLDASLLVANDPFEGLSFDESATVQVADRPGIGARFRA
ncbi:MAG TPA: dipeptide epimerase [Anaerolineaceae bacterium]|nr:dipeptide epimerase [Anaerolineaceae bacterium]